MFTINGVDWNVIFVHPLSDDLKRSDGSKTVGVTDGNINTIFLSDRLQGEFLRRVFAHELCHAFCMSYNVIMDIEQEEFMCDWISLYGTKLIYLLDDLMPVLLKMSA